MKPRLPNVLIIIALLALGAAWLTISQPAMLAQLQSRLFTKTPSARDLAATDQRALADVAIAASNYTADHAALPPSGPVRVSAACSADPTTQFCAHGSPESPFDGYLARTPECSHNSIVILTTTGAPKDNFLVYCAKDPRHKFRPDQLHPPATS